MSPTVSFTTLGCRLNQAESDSMTEAVTERGLIPVAPGGEPDVVVINTCTVTREATKASRMAIRRAIRAHPDARVVVMGCYAVSDPDEIAEIEGVDLILGNDEKDDLPAALGMAPATAPLLDIGFRKAVTTSPPPEPKIRANLKVQTGCDEWCSFCIIPTTRGPLRSLDEDELVESARRKLASGSREIVLTGVHLGKYMYDHAGDERDLIRLLQRLLALEGLWRLRLSSILSQHLTDDVISLIAAEERICRHLHVPLQSGDDGVLRAMNRPYSIAGYVDRVKAALEAIPGLALATDIIVGFPGESDAAFTATLDVVEDLRFSKLHVFRYSPRPGTASADLRDEIHPDIKKERSKTLIDVGNSIRAEFLRAHLEHPLRVLVEDERIVDGSAVCSGQTDDYVRVWFEAEGLLGAMVDVKGHEVRADGIRGAELLDVIRDPTFNAPSWESVRVESGI